MQRVEATGWTGMRVDATRREFEAFFCEHQDSVLRLAQSITGDRETASDAAQEAFVKILDRWSRVSKMDKPEAFLKRAVVRCAIDVLRYQKRQGEQEERAGRQVETERMAVRQVLERLKPEHRAVLALSVGEGWSYAEIAESLGIPQGTVGSRIHNAKEAFRKEWGNEP